MWGRTYPFNEHPDIDWHRCSVTVTREGMPGLKETLEAMVADGRYADMVACLRETRVVSGDGVNGVNATMRVLSGDW